MEPRAQTLRRAPGEGRNDQFEYLWEQARSKLLNRCGFFRELLGMTVTTDTVNAASASVNPNFTCRFLTAEELQPLADVEANRLPSKLIDTALARGDRCYGIFDGDKLASYGWYTSTGPNQFNDELEITFDPGWVYMYHGFTLPEYRGQKLHAVGMSRALEAITDEGYAGLISCVDAVNRPSLRSCARMGYRIFGSVTVWRWLAADRSGLGPLASYRIRATADCQLFGFDVIAVRPAGH